MKTDNPQLELAFNYAQYTNRSIFLTGKAGTGKTTFLKRLQAQTCKRMIVVAPTGVAAINAGGVTIHSFFQLAPGLYLPGKTISRGEQSNSNRYGFSKHKINILRTLDLLVIDEISMVRCDLLDAIDEVLRRYQNHYKPFGGVQLLLIGDLQQLAPVAKEDEWKLLEENGYTSPYFFGSRALSQTSYTTIELTKVYRQADQNFIDLLNKVRDNHLDTNTLQQLNSRYQPHFKPKDEEGYITLTTHNFQANDINQMKLAMLPTEPEHFKAKIKGDFPEMSYPTDEELVLKIGAQVMFCKNDPSPSKQYYNGKIGRVIQFSNDQVVVECKENDGSEQVILVGQQEWTNAKYVTDEKTGEIKEEIAGTFTQIPLRTAWAITIHKSQGLTFDRCIINAGRAFSAGQVYVALSRCRTLEGMVLSTPLTTDAIRTDKDVMAYNQYVSANQPDMEQLRNDRLVATCDTLCNLFDFMPIATRLRYVHRLAEEHLPKALKYYVDNLRIMIAQTEDALEIVGKRFQLQIQQLIPQAATYEENVMLQERVKKGATYFLDKTALIFDEFLEKGLPEIENKRSKEQLEREFGTLKEDYTLKVQLLLNVMHKGFSMDGFWNTKAAATMQFDKEGQPGYASHKKATASTTKKRATTKRGRKGKAL